MGDDDDDVYCASHDDCGGNTPFCYDGLCDTCDQCQNCDDGIDGTCGPCGATTSGDTCASATYITVQEAYEMWTNDEFDMIIDVRAFEDRDSNLGYSTYHIPGSINVPELGWDLSDNQDWASMRDESCKDMSVLVVCYGGALSFGATDYLLSNGWSNIYTSPDGEWGVQYNGWVEMGYETDSGEGTTELPCDNESPSSTHAPMEYGEMVEMDIHYQSPDGDDLTGYCVYMNLPGDPERPGLILFGGFWGDGGDENERDIAKDFAAMGFTVFIPDYFPGTHSTDSMEDLADSFAKYGPFLEDTVKAQGVAMAAYEQLMNAPNVDPSKINAIGFCFGGAMVLNLARAGADLVVAASLHGEYPARGAMTGTYNVKYFAEIVGSADPIINDEAREEWVSELEEHTSGSDEMSYEMIVWGNAYHGFAIQYSQTFYEFIAQGFETDVISDEEHGNIGAAGVMLWEEERQDMSRERIINMLMDCDVFESSPIQSVFTEKPGYYCTGNWDDDYEGMSFGATLDMCMSACYSYSMEGETCTGIVYGDIGEDENSLCVICSTDTWETNWFAKHTITGYSLGADRCACEEGYGWSSENSACEMGSTTNCSECPLMDGCDTSMCMDRGDNNDCPMSYDPMRMCQCTGDCEEYGNCCDDASSCHDSDDSEDDSEDTTGDGEDNGDEGEDNGDESEDVPCVSHDDCGEDTPFCYDGSCSTCDQCQNCWDGVDGTCGPCGQTTSGDTCGVLTSTQSPTGGEGYVFVSDESICSYYNYEVLSSEECIAFASSQGLDGPEPSEGPYDPAGCFYDRYGTLRYKYQLDISRGWTCGTDDNICICKEESYVCVGEISSMDERCGRIDNQEDCEAEGVNAFSDGVCDWVAEENVETTCMPVVCGCSPGFNTVEITDGNGCVTECSCEPQTCVANLISSNMKCSGDTKFKDAINNMDTADNCVAQNEGFGTMYNFISMRDSGCVLETTCPESERVRTNLDWQLYEVVCS